MDQECAVCLKPNSDRCSGCKRVFFCSPAHQELLWPTHKFLCKLEDQSTFRFPPLTKAEANFVRQHMKDIEVISGFTQKMPGFAGHKLIDFFEWIGMYEGTLEDLLNGVTAGSQDPIQEPYLSSICIILRGQMITPMQESLPPPPQPLPYRCHSYFAVMAFEFMVLVSPMDHHFDSPEKSTFRTLNEYFRVLLDYATLFRLHGEFGERLVPPSMLRRLLDKLEKIDTTAADPHLSYYAKRIIYDHVRMCPWDEKGAWKDPPPERKALKPESVD